MRLQAVRMQNGMNNAKCSSATNAGAAMHYDGDIGLEQPLNLLYQIQKGLWLLWYAVVWPTDVM
jgi:hypothetical protein